MSARKARASVIIDLNFYRNSTSPDIYSSRIGIAMGGTRDHPGVRLADALMSSLVFIICRTMRGLPVNGAK
jgi:glutamate dehydrogenase/leucine dehydrogenase